MKCNLCGFEFEGKLCPNCGSSVTSEIKPKKPFYKKWWIWAIIAVVAIAVIGIFGGKTDAVNDTYLISAASQQPEDEQNTDITIKNIDDFEFENYSLEIGDSVELTTKIEPKGIEREDFVIVSSDNEIVDITDITVSDFEIYTQIKFKCNALAIGSSVVKIIFADEKMISNEVYFTVEQPSKIKTISEFGDTYIKAEVRETRSFTVYMTPSGITKEDFIITNTDSSVADISEVQAKDDGDQTVITFTVSTLKSGSTEISVASIDGKTVSNVIAYSVKDKGANRTVYVTTNGKKYHFSASCAGKNATETTLSQASSDGKSACKKCVH